MKIFYNDSEVSNTTISYEDLSNKPLINSSELSGNVSLDDLDIYSKFDVDLLARELSASRSVYVLASLPLEVKNNSLYYIGPTSTGKYNTYVVDDTGTTHDLGLNELPMYSAGDCIRIDDSNTISLNYDTDSFNLVSNAITPKIATVNTPGAVMYDSTFTVNSNNLCVKEFVSGKNAGSNSKPVYLNDGTFTALSGNIGSNNNTPIYMNYGTLTAFSTKLVSLLYPVGSIYMSVTLDTAAKVQNALGGTWVAWGTGRCPVGVDTSQTEFNTVEKTGGEKTHTLTVNEMPSHSHKYKLYASSSTTAPTMTDVLENTNVNYADGYTDYTGEDQPHNNLQPYITCYMWKKTAL